MTIPNHSPIMPHLPDDPCQDTYLVYQYDDAKEEIKCLQVVEDFQTAYATSNTYNRRS